MRVEMTAPPVHRYFDIRLSQSGDPSRTCELRSLISGCNTLAMASSNVSPQKLASSVFESRHANTVRRQSFWDRRLSVRDFDRQVAKLQNRVAVLNGYTALGIPVTNSCGMSLSDESENSDIIGFGQLN